MNAEVSTNGNDDIICLFWWRVTKYPSLFWFDICEMIDNI